MLGILVDVALDYKLAHALRKLCTWELLITFLHLSTNYSQLLPRSKLLLTETDHVPQGKSVAQDVSSEKLLFFGTLSRSEPEHYQWEVKRLDAWQAVSYVVSLAQIDFERLTVVCILDAFKLNNEVACSQSIEGLGKWVRTGVVDHECRILQSIVKLECLLVWVVIMVSDLPMLSAELAHYQSITLIGSSRSSVSHLRCQCAHARKSSCCARQRFWRRFLRTCAT